MTKMIFPESYDSQDLIDIYSRIIKLIKSIKALKRELSSSSFFSSTYVKKQNKIFNQKKDLNRLFFVLSHHYLDFVSVNSDYFCSDLRSFDHCRFTFVEGVVNLRCDKSLVIKYRDNSIVPVLGEKPASNPYHFLVVPHEFFFKVEEYINRLMEKKKEADIDNLKQKLKSLTNEADNVREQIKRLEFY